MRANTELAVRADAVGDLYILPWQSKDQPGSCVKSVKVTARGAIRSCAIQVKLEPKLHLYQMRGDTLINAAGFDYINQSLGVSFWKPDFVIGDDGQKHGNPYIERDQYGTDTRIQIRFVGIGRTPVGNQIAIDSTLVYDLKAVFAQGFLAAWQGDDDVPLQPWGKLIDAADATKEPGRKNIPIPGEFVLSVDCSDPKVVSLVREHAGRVNRAGRGAETICKRNILRRFLGRSSPAKDNSVTVIAWVEMDVETSTQLEELVAQAQAGNFRLDQQRDDIIDVEGESGMVEEDDSTKPAPFQPGQVAPIDPVVTEPAEEETALEQKSSLGPDVFNEIQIEIDDLVARNKHVEGQETFQRYNFGNMDDVRACDNVRRLGFLLDDLRKLNEGYAS